MYIIIPQKSSMDQTSLNVTHLLSTYINIKLWVIFHQLEMTQCLRNGICTSCNFIYELCEHFIDCIISVFNTLLEALKRLRLHAQKVH